MRHHSHSLFRDTDSRLLKQIAGAQHRLYRRLRTLDPKSTDISEYNQRYLGGKLRRPWATLQLHGRLLYLALSRGDIPLDRAVVVDYGGGTGILSFLAKELGVGRVVYNDIYDVSCRDVHLLSTHLGLPVDHVVCGDIDEVISFLHVNSLQVQAITSHDVLEHIYDVEYHFRRLGSMRGEFRIVYASGANIENPRRVRALTQRQLDAEYKNKVKRWGQKERDTLRAFFEVRKDLISECAPELASDEVEKLARLTRGLIRSDIEKCVNEYRHSGGIAYRPQHPTNTCDPYTGNWCEHLMDMRWLQQVIGDAGFSVEILPGYYPVIGSPLRQGVARGLNAAVRLLQRRSLFMAPYYIVYAEPARRPAVVDVVRVP